MERPLNRKSQLHLIRAEEDKVKPSMLFQRQLLATKFYVPVAAGPLICRPRLTNLLTESLKYSLTLVSTPPGFGKTTLLSIWTQSLPAKHLQLAWVSLDQEDNEPRLFWIYVLSALQKHQPERFTLLLGQLQSSQGPPLKYILTALVNLLADSTQYFVLILDDYQVITEHEVHATLVYLIEHLSPQLRIIIATRADPPLPLVQLRARQQVLEVRTAQLRCTVEETKAFFKDVMGVQFPDEIIQEVTTRTEGWLVGLQLLSLSLSAQANPLTLLQEASGDQRYILDYLTEEVLRQQPLEVQTFLLSTCILERLTAPLCDAIMQQHDSQQLLERLEQANLFVISLDHKRQWYRYHALFAQALHYQMEQTQADRLLILHHRASIWYAEHHQTTEAILHAFHAHQWQWAADLIEQKLFPLMSHVWGASRHELILFRQWLEQLPAEVIHSRPRLCLACALLLWQVAPQPVVEAWLDKSEAILTALLTKQQEVSPSMLTSQAQKNQANLLGEEIAWRAFMQCHTGDGQNTHSLCQQAHSLLSADNYLVHAIVSWAQFRASYVSSANDAVGAIQNGLQAGSFAQAAGQTTLAIVIMGTTACCMLGAGQLHEVQRLTQQAIQLGKQPGELVLPNVGWPALFQAEILREWNQLAEALTLVSESIEQCKQTESMSSLTHLLFGYAMLLRVQLSCGELDAAYSALQEFEHIGTSMNRPLYLQVCSHFTAIDKVKLWLARGELEHATRWAEELDMRERPGTPFMHEREEVVRVRVFLAKDQSMLALQHLEPMLQRATTAQRWGHVIEMRLLQVLAHKMCHEETQALSALAEAIRLAEPEGYIRSFVEEGAPMTALLFKLQEEQRRHGPTPYLDILLAAFQQKSKGHEPQRKREGRSMIQLLPEPLSQREQQVLQLLAHGSSNQEIGQELVITVDTVKRHVSHIFAKLGTQNRLQAVTRARELDLLDELSL
jgi:LuxR family maltose regulon positive regulatory protein